MTLSLYIKNQKRLSEIQEVLNRSKTAKMSQINPKPIELEQGAFRLIFHIDSLDKCSEEIDKIIDNWYLEDKK